MAGWNFFFYQACLIPFEISALNLVLTFWRDDIPVAAVCAACIALYALFNVFAVRWYGEAEFWLSSGKFFLIILLSSFTFFTMVSKPTLTVFLIHDPATVPSLTVPRLEPTPNTTRSASGHGTLQGPFESISRPVL